jgi:hypothetical protein
VRLADVRYHLDAAAALAARLDTLTSEGGRPAVGLVESLRDEVRAALRAAYLIDTRGERRSA